MDFAFNYALTLLQHLLLRPPPPEARALAPTATALRRRRKLLPGVPWPPGGGGGGGEGEAGGEEGAAQWSEAGSGARGAATPPRPPRLRSPPPWVLELHLGAMPAVPGAWADLAVLPQLAALLLPGQRPRLPAAALPALAQLGGLRALQLSVGLLAAPGIAPAGVPAAVLAERVASLGALTGLTHLSLHANALPSRPLTRALAALTGLRDLFVAGGGGAPPAERARGGGPRGRGAGPWEAGLNRPRAAARARGVPCLQRRRSVATACGSRASRATLHRKGTRAAQTASAAARVGPPAHPLDRPAPQAARW
jgi:hypothetical protein